MKIPVLILSSALLSAASSQAAVHALFTAQTQTVSAGTVTGANGLVSANTFPTAPTLTRTGTSSLNTGGEAAYTDFQGFTWSGSGTQNTPGHSFGWGPGATNISFTITLNLANLEDLSIRMAIRSSASNGATPVSAFSAIEYSLNNGASFSTAASGATLDFATGSAFNEYLLDLSSLSEIEGQSNVQIRFSAANLPTDTSLRIDNILLTAVPEPSAAVLLGLTGIVSVYRRRRA